MPLQGYLVLLWFFYESTLTLFALRGFILDLMTLTEEPEPLSTHVSASCTGAWQQNFGVAESLRSINTVTKVNKQPQPASISLPRSALSPSTPTTPNRKVRLLRRARYGTSPGDRYVTPPKTLWHNYTSVALKTEGEGGGEAWWGTGVAGGRKEMVGTEQEWVSERRSGGCAGSVVLVDALLPAYSKRQPKGCLSFF